jgi:O-antigen ligase
MRNLAVLAAVLLAFHYPITTPILLWLDVSTTDANAIIKGFISALFLSAIFISYRNNTKIRYLIPLFVFLFIYGIRLLYDVIALGILVNQSRTYILGYFFGLTLIPCVAVAACISRVDVERLHRWSFVALIAANVALLFYLAVYGAPSAEAAFASRLEVEGDVEGTAIINPIMVGLMGAILVAFALGRLAVVESRGPWQPPIHFSLVVLGSINLLLGASRGPALAFLLCFAILIYTLVRGGAGVGRLKTRASTWIYAGALCSAVLYLVFTRMESFFLFDRLFGTFEGRVGTEERDFIYSMAWNDFLGSPIFGSSYVVSAGNALAHNFVLDAFMSTGVVGGVFFVVAFFWALVGTFRMLHGEAGPHGYSIALAAVCFMVVGATSGSVGQTPELWLFLALTTVLGNRAAKPYRPPTAFPAT